MRKNSSGFAKSYLSGAFPNPQRISAALPIEVPSNLAAKVHWQRKANGRPLGIARAKLYAPEQFREWAGLGGIATRNRYGKEFFREIRKVPKRYLNGYVTGKMKARPRSLTSNGSV